KNKKLKPSEALLTSDEINIAYKYYAPEKINSPAVILLHMLGKDKSDWVDFARKLQKEGFAVIAIDFRGHGDSDGNWQKFSEKDFNNMILDVDAAKEFLGRQPKVNTNSLSIIGSSIGANIAVKYALKTEVKTIVLLSPGSNYRGVNIEKDISSLKIPVFLAASDEDTYSAESSKKINELLKTTSEFVLLNNAGHGNNMFVVPELSDKIISWLKK
ncbi:MAG: alpha/beta fold hydrolase, partial [Candidatus Woesearchaeota archaeon]|nr:alpha/beta fold hydrolase [Candidatus Woesearchaeota archaeon]